MPWSSRARSQRRLVAPRRLRSISVRTSGSVAWMLTLQRRQPLGDDPLEVGLGEAGEGGEVPVEERQPVVVVLEVEALPQPGRQLVDEAELAVVVAGAHLVEQRRLHLDAERLAGPLVPPRPCSSSPPRPRSSTGSASSTSNRYSMMSRGTWPSMPSTSSPTATPARAAGDPGATATTRGAGIGQGYGPGLPDRPSVSLGRRWPSTGCCSPRPGASAPAWRWRSRRWRGWCGPSSRPCTATTRSSTTSWSSTASATSASCSSTTSPRCRRAARSCCRPTARRPRSWPRPGPAAATWSTPSARSSPRCTTR